MSMFGHESQHGHMMAGVQKALASSKTPAHLKSHLEKRMKQMPNTGAKPQNKPKAVAKNPMGTSSFAEKQIAAPPEPFRNPKGAANVKVPSKTVKMKKKSSFFGGR